MPPTLAPLILIGYASMFGTSIDRYPFESNTPQLELRTGYVSIGGYINATPTGLYAGGIHYGFSHTMSDNWSVSVIPHFGVSHTDHMIAALPSYTQFDVGTGVYAIYEHLVMGINASHWSNGNAVFNWSDSAGRQNVGINMVVVQIGYIF